MQGLGPPAPHAEKNPCLTFDSPKNIKLSLGIHRSWFQDLLWIVKSTDTQVPYINWHRSMHIVSPLHLWTLNCGSKIVQVFIYLFIYLFIHSFIVVGFKNILILFFLNFIYF